MYLYNMNQKTKNQVLLKLTYPYMYTMSFLTFNIGDMTISIISDHFFVNQDISIDNSNKKWKSRFSVY